MGIIGGGVSVDIYIDQVPEECEWEAYPPDTLFVHDDSRPKRDPVTFQLIRPERRPLIYPEEAWAEYNKTHGA